MKKYTSILPIQLILIIAFVITGCSPDETQKNANTLGEKDQNSYQAEGIIAKSLPEISDALAHQNITSEALVRLYLARIAEIDKNGPKLQAVLSLNPNAISDAQESDRLRRIGNIKGPMHGIPILLKDNIEAKDPIATTAGSSALKDNITGRDSPLVADLRQQGAIILGKTNLSQWANFRSESSMSGWSSLGGQVRNAHMLDRNPCGSSSGSAVATAASLAAATVGTETNGSIICPANASSIVGFKPTVGLISQDYIIPISVSQDTAGPLTKTVKGAAMMMNAMTRDSQIDYTELLKDTALKGVRVGVLHFAEGQNNNIKNLFEEALKDIETAGAILIDINESPSSSKDVDNQSYDLLKYEFKDGMNRYLSSLPNDVPVRSLKELIDFNNAHSDVELTLFDQSIFIASDAMKSLDTPEYIATLKAVQKANRENGIDFLLKYYNVDLLIAPSGPIVPRVDPINGDVWPEFPGAGSMAAIAGYPHASVPMGTIHHLPVNISFIGSQNQDANILSYAYAYEQISKKRVSPQYLKNAEDIASIEKALNP
ncbi:MAG: amidase [Emcibacter sp.]|nr:amidase [Emcibacter sp.]